MSAAKEPDRRLNPYRDDLAAGHLRGEVKATRFVEGEDKQVKIASTPLMRRPEITAPMETQLLLGEVFRVYEERSGWAWGQSAQDDYVGYVDIKALAAKPCKPTHSVAAIRTFLYARADLKSRPVTPIPMNAKLKVIATRGDFSEIETGGWVFTAHLEPVGSYERDFVSVAERLVGTPYLWGGRDTTGLDCSGLVQCCLERAGISSLRDTDMQEATLGEALPPPLETANLMRGDLVFWKGHVGIMCDETRLVHASGYQMRVEIEPLRQAVERIARAAGPVTSIKRLTRL